jgi:hypothetical protein
MMTRHLADIFDAFNVNEWLKTQRAILGCRQLFHNPVLSGGPLESSRPATVPKVSEWPRLFDTCGAK